MLWVLLFDETLSTTSGLTVSVSVPFGDREEHYWVVIVRRVGKAVLGRAIILWHILFGSLPQSNDLKLQLLVCKIPFHRSFEAILYGNQYGNPDRD
jgi:hypothetical protein